MAYKDLRDFLKLLESKGLLKHISAEADPVLEIAEIPKISGSLSLRDGKSTDLINWL